MRQRYHNIVSRTFQNHNVLKNFVSILTKYRVWRKRLYVFSGFCFGRKLFCKNAIFMDVSKYGWGDYISNLRVRDMNDIWSPQKQGHSSSIRERKALCKVAEYYALSLYGGQICFNNREPSSIMGKWSCKPSLSPKRTMAVKNDPLEFILGNSEIRWRFLNEMIEYVLMYFGRGRP